MSSSGHSPSPSPLALGPRCPAPAAAAAWLDGVPRGRGWHQPGPSSASPGLQLSHPSCRRHMSAREFWFDVAGLLLFLNAAEGDCGAQGSCLFGSLGLTLGPETSMLGTSEIRNVLLLVSKIWLRETRCTTYNRIAFVQLNPPGLRGRKIRGEVRSALAG